jgi:hypothetical protein
MLADVVLDTKFYNKLFSSLRLNRLISQFPVVLRSKERVCGPSLAGIAGSNPTVSKNVSFGCCVLSGRSLCVGLITPPEESCGEWCV